MSNETTKKPIARWQVITAIVVVAIIVACVVMGLVSRKSIGKSEFSDFEYVNVYDNTNIYSPLITIFNDDNKGEDNDNFLSLLNEGIKSTKYSVLRNVLEINFDSNFVFLTETVEEKVYEYDDDGYLEKDDDGEYEYDIEETEEKVTMEGSTVATTILSGTAKFVLEFVYSEQTTVKVEGEEIIFDTMRVEITDSGSMIKQYQMYLTDSKSIAQAEQSIDYEITPILYKSDLTVLYERLGDIKEVLTGDSDNGDE